MRVKAGFENLISNRTSLSNRVLDGGGGLTTDKVGSNGRFGTNTGEFECTFFKTLKVHYETGGYESSSHTCNKIGRERSLKNSDNR